MRCQVSNSEGVVRLRLIYCSFRLQSTRLPRSGTANVSYRLRIPHNLCHPLVFWQTFKRLITTYIRPLKSESAAQEETQETQQPTTEKEEKYSAKITLCTIDQFRIAFMRTLPNSPTQRSLHQIQRAPNTRKLNLLSECSARDF